MKIDAYIATDEQGYVKAISQWTDDWDTKYGELETRIASEDLEVKTIGGQSYRHVLFTIDLQQNENAEALAFSIV